MTMEKWQKGLIPTQADIEGQGVTGATDKGDPSALAQSEEVARRTREFLVTRGWCLWKCSVLNGDIIVVVRDVTVAGYPEFPVYTVAELEELCQDGVSEATIRLVHEAKKAAGAVVVGVEAARVSKAGATDRQ